MNNIPLSITPIPAFKDNYIWLVTDAATQQSIVVDPGDAQPLIDFVVNNKINLVGVVITHRHWDHCNGITELQQRFKIPALGPANEKEAINGVTVFLRENDNLKNYQLPFDFSVMDIPGHTQGHIAYYGQGVIFTGDTLFTGGCGRLFEGTPEQMHHSLSKLAALPEETKIYCGHEYTLANLVFAQAVEPHNEKIKNRLISVKELRNKNISTVPSLLKEELATNPFLRCSIPEVIAAVENYARMRLNDRVAVFKYLREWKNGF